MVASAATSVEQYLRELPANRRRELEAVREVVRANLPTGYIESIEFGMIGYAIPLARFPDTYNGKALCYAGLAAQKNHNALYLMGCYMDPAHDRALRAGAVREGKKLDMGKSCLRFRRAEDLPLKTIGALVARTPIAKLIALHESVHGPKRRAKPASAAASKRATASPARKPGAAAAPARRKRATAGRAAKAPAAESAGGPRRARAVAAARTRGRRMR